MNESSNSKCTLLEKEIGYKFNNIELLIEALTHPSMKQIDNSIFHYERLEFLGDSVLGFIITEMIFIQKDKLNEGDLAKIKAHMISSPVLVKVAQDINLADYLIMTKGEENSGGRHNNNNIENSIEALLAAIYLDGGLVVVRNMIHKFWHKLLDNINFRDVDPKTFLQELLQKEKFSAPKYELVSRVGSVHEPLFTVKILSCYQTQLGQGKTIKEAEKNAARKLLDFLNKKNN